jgi:hypothetical protein
MNSITLIIISVILAIVLRWLMDPVHEGFDGDRRDLHLTINNDRYVNPYYTGRDPYNRYVWNNATRYINPYYYYQEYLFPYINYYWGY